MPARSWRRALARLPRLALLTLACLCLASPARAQASGMPDMSHAPADVQAIWRKVMSGGIPSAAEAAKLRQYMMAHRDAIIAGARAQVPAATTRAQAAKRQAAAAEAAQEARGAAGAATASDDATSCPTRSPALARVASIAPGASAAAALLDTLRRVYAAAETPADVRRLDEILGRIPDGAPLSMAGSLLFGNGYDDAAVLTFVAAARRGGTTAQLAWTGLGGALEGAGDDVHAAAVFRRALALGDRAALDVYGLGVAYVDLGDLATALPLLEEATRLAPRLAIAWDALGRTQACAHQMVAARNSMAKAQEVDWSEHREAETVGREAKDDRTEAQRPMPTPTRLSYDPPPAPKAFIGEVPTIPDSWTESTGWSAAFAQASNAYMNEMNPILQHAEVDENAVRGGELAVSGDGAGGIGLVVDVSNTREAVEAVDRVQQRMSARLMMMQEAYSAKDSSIDVELAPDYAAADRKFEECKAKAVASNGDWSKCEPPYCRDQRALLTRRYEGRRDAARVFIGGVMGTMQQYDRAMRGWFMFASDPVIRVRIDAQRRSQLASLEHDAFLGAAEVGSVDRRDTCIDLPPEVRTPPEAKADSAADPGKCSGGTIHVERLAEMEADCRHMTMTLAIDELPVTPIFQFRKAAKGRHGEIFIGVGKGRAWGLLNGSIGLQANFDEGGWITSAGIGLHGSVGYSAVATLDAEETLNLSSHGSLIDDGAATVSVSPRVTAAAAWIADAARN